MSTFRPGDEVNDIIEFPIFDVATETWNKFDFEDAGYAADEDLDDDALGQVTIYGSTAPDFSDDIEVQVGGSAVDLDGTVFAKRHPTNGRKAYFSYNLPETVGTYYFKAVFEKEDEDDQKSIPWQHTVSN